MKAFFNCFFRKSEEAGMAVIVIAIFFSGLHFGWASTFQQNIILFLALVVAVFSMRNARKTERQKVTLDVLSAYNDSHIVMAGTAILNEWNNGDEHLNLSKEDRVAVREFLNFFEFLAIGLKHEIYDEKMVMDSMETAIVRYYKKGKNFIEQFRMRDVTDVSYEHFEKLARRIQARQEASK